MATPDVLGNTPAGQEPDSAPVKDWRDKLFEVYEASGFNVYVALARPPKQPARQNVESGECWDYTTAFLPWESPEDEQRAADYAGDRCALRERYGDLNVRSVYPTEAMQRAVPLVPLDNYVLLAIRPGAELPAA